MSLDPATIMQLIQKSQGQQVVPPAQAQAFQSAQLPGVMASRMGNAPAGSNASAGTVNAMTKLALAMMQRKRMQDYQKQYGSPGMPQAPTQSQGVTLSGPVDNSSAPTGMMGPP
jgi:hypothetical protein